jgi:hypothetical protein
MTDEVGATTPVVVTPSELAAVVAVLAADVDAHALGSLGIPSVEEDDASVWPAFQSLTLRGLAQIELEKVDVDPRLGLAAATLSCPDRIVAFVFLGDDDSATGVRWVERDDVRATLAPASGGSVAIWMGDVARPLAEVAGEFLGSADTIPSRAGVVVELESGVADVASLALERVAGSWRVVSGPDSAGATVEGAIAALLQRP